METYHRSTVPSIVELRTLFKTSDSTREYRARRVLARARRADKAGDYTYRTPFYWSTRSGGRAYRGNAPEAYGSPN